MKRILPIILIFIVFLIGVGILSYPLLSAVVNNTQARRGAKTYIQEALASDTAEIDAAFEEAQIYNDSLHRVILTDPFDTASYGEISDYYKNTFRFGEDGIIGYVEIPKINVFLPIYHGTSIEVLSMGAGHLENTSLPIGGESTHSVISAHSAYPSETFFDYLTDLEEGDAFYIHVLNRTLKYEVDKIRVVLPEDTSDLHIYDGEDYVTLLTCTPFSVNTHRLLVRGTRVPYTAEDSNRDIELSAVSMGDGYMYFMGYKLSFLTVGLIIAGFVAFVGLSVFLLVRLSRGGRKDGG